MKLSIGGSGAAYDGDDGFYVVSSGDIETPMTLYVYLEVDELQCLLMS